MGAFILFPVLIFSVFITAILGFTDWIHVDTLVHAAAQAAVTAAAENAVAPGTSGIYNGSGMPAQLGALSTWTNWNNNMVFGSANGEFSIANGSLTYLGTGASSPEGILLSHVVTVVPGQIWTVSAYVNATNVMSAPPYSAAVAVWAPNISVTYALLDQTDGQQGTLSQTFTIPPGVTQIELSYQTRPLTATAGLPVTWSNIQLTPQTSRAANPNSAPLDEANINLTVGQMLTGKPYITNYSCSTTTSVVTCKVNFNVSMPIVGTVHATTTVSATNTSL